MITGAGGLVGQALARHLGSRHDLTPLLHRELDITKRDQVDHFVRSVAPSVIINCAVMGVDECEDDPGRAHELNVQGPAFLARAAAGAGAAIVHLSTNYVFSGDRTDGSFYAPDDEAFPINVYGATKLEGENAVLAACERAVIIRTSWVFGDGKPTFLSTVGAKLSRGEVVNAITDIHASTTHVGDLVRRIEALIDLDLRGIYHVINDGVCSYAEFADAAAEILNIRADTRATLIQRTSAETVMRTAPRPRWTPMRSTDPLRPMRPWREALADYLKSGESG